MNEPTARRVVLAHAIEVGDSECKLLSQSERDQIDVQARQAAMRDSSDDPARVPERFLALRAQRVIEAVEARSPGLAGLQHETSWQRWLAAGLPLAAVLMGVLTDVVANPHRVDLLSLPLLGIVAWNLVMYLALFGGWLLLGRRHPSAVADVQHRRAEGLLRWRRGSGQVRAEVTALFHLRWQQASRGLTLQRWKRVLHLSAAGWAIGISLSLLTRGLVVEYRVGWESTFLDAGQVHAILSALRLPALLLFPFQPFSVQEVAALQFTQGGGAIGGARWVFMYVALLLVLVVVPRVLLAAFAYWRERALARQVPIDVHRPYYQRLLSLLTSVRVHLCLYVHRPQDRAALERVLVQEGQEAGTLISTLQDDVLRLLDVSDLQPPPEAPEQSPGWLLRLRQQLGALRGEAGTDARDPAAATARSLGDVVLHVVGAPEDLAQADTMLRWLGKPVLVLVNPPEGALVHELVALCRSRAGEQPLAKEVLSFDEFARCWIQERVLLDAIAHCLPERSKPGFERLAVAWDERNRSRLSRSMAAIAEHLLYAARQVQEVPSGALTVRSLVPAERQVQAQARQAAMGEVVKRLEGSAAEMFSRLRVLHGIDASAAMALQHRLHENFVVQQTVDTPQAGMAGAATGAAMGASVDLLVGGLTLGAATALGALVGGSAAYIAAAWKNRSTAGGATVVQLSDEMLQAITEASLLRYLAVALHGRGSAASSAELPTFWTAEVVAAVEAQRDHLVPFWTMARTQPEVGRFGGGLVHELEKLARTVLESLYRAPPKAG